MTDTAAPRGDRTTERQGNGETKRPSTSPSPEGPIAAAAALLMLGSIASRLLGLIREQVMAGLFGATGGTDAFVAAYTVPTTIYDLLVGGAISAALVPVLVDVAERDERFWRLASALLSLACLAAAVAAAALMLLAPLVMSLLGQGFPDERQDLAVLMVRLMLPALVLQGVSGVAMAVLYARQHFALPAFAAAAFNLGIILAALALHAVMGIAALVVGVLLGALLQAALQVPGLVRLGLRFRPTLDLQMPEVRSAVRLYGPVAAGMLVTIAGVVIDRNLASRLEEGSMSVMRYATTLVQFPLGLVGIATSLAVLPTLSRHASAFTAGGRDSLDDYRHTLGFGIRLVLLLMVPATVGLAVLREPLVALLFQRGEFTGSDTLRTSLVFLAYAPQMPFTALDQLLIVAFYARKDTRTPVLVGVGTVLLYLASALLLLTPLRVVGLAAANTIQNTAHGLVLFLLLQRSVGGLASRALLVHVLKVGGAAAVMGLALLALALPLVTSAEGALPRLASLAVAAVVAGALYLAIVEALRVPEARVVRELVLSRLR